MDAAQRRGTRCAPPLPPAHQRHEPAIPCCVAPRSSPRSARPPTRRGVLEEVIRRGRRRRPRQLLARRARPITAAASMRVRQAAAGGRQARGRARRPAGAEDPHRAVRRRARHARRRASRSRSTRSSTRTTARDRGVGIDLRRICARDVRRATSCILGDGQIELARRARSTARASSAACIVGGELVEPQGHQPPAAAACRRRRCTDKDREDVAARGAARRRLPRGVVRAPGGGHRRKRAQLLRAAGSDARIVAKIERSEAIPRLEEIVRRQRRA
ncbi:MAG: hypothetical protein MZW92_03920 [Comamonadaceae bacterium]|nr:hypothetical protein [Comamonadaceae bacterium]